jgi:hypothetical protein
MAAQKREIARRALAALQGAQNAQERKFRFFPASVQE